MEMPSVMLTNTELVVPLGIEEGRHMKHTRQVTRPNKVNVMKAMDPAGAAFFQIWLAVMSTMLFGAFGGKE
jgi:hypothetical protein